LIVAFSDGVTEAMNPAGEEFTDDRLLACAEKNRGKSPQDILDALLAEVQAFGAGATQSDDVTVLIVRYNGRS
jgi:phosphoserine phosphatase RsbU/P